MRYKLVAALAAAVAILGFTAPPAQAVIVPPLVLPYPLTVDTVSAVGSTTTCHGVTLVAVSGQFVTSGSLLFDRGPLRKLFGLSTVADPTVTYVWQSDPTKTVTMTGHSTRWDEYYRYRWTTRSLGYDWTFTNPDGTVFGQQVGYQGITASGELIGAMKGSCSTPL